MTPHHLLLHKLQAASMDFGQADRCIAR